MPDVAPIALRDQASALAPLQGASSFAEAARPREAALFVRDLRLAGESYRPAVARVASGGVTLEGILLDAWRPPALTIIEHERPDAWRRTEPGARRGGRRRRLREAYFPWRGPVVGTVLDLVA